MYPLFFNSTFARVGVIVGIDSFKLIHLYYTNVSLSTDNYTFVKFSSVKLKRLVEGDKRLSKEIAVDGGFSVSSISHWALGRRVPGADELAALARVFKKPIEYFFEGEGSALTANKDAIPYRVQLAPDKIAKLQQQVLNLRQQADALQETINELKS